MPRTLFLLLIAVQLFAIVAVKPREVGQNPGLTGDVSAAFKTQRGNTDTDDYTGGVSLQYDSNTTYLLWGMVNGEYSKSSGVTDANNLYGHLRFIQDIDGKWIAFEAYTQVEEDQFQDIKQRYVVGVGMREKVMRLKSEWGGLFIGIGPMVELIDYTSPQLNPEERNVRLNSYVSYSLTLKTGTQFVASGYYQPKVDEFRDYLVALAGQVEVPIYKQLFFGFTIQYSYDSSPAIGVVDYDFTQRTLLKYKF